MTLDDICDAVWVAMRSQYFRRAVLGKTRCSELVMLSLANFPDRSLKGVKQASIQCDNLSDDFAQTVEQKYRQKTQPPPGTYGAVFTSLILAWAIKAIVGYLIDQWFAGKLNVSEIRNQYGWSNG